MMQQSRNKALRDLDELGGHNAMSCATTQLATLKRQTTIPRPIAQLVYMTPDDSVIESVMLQASDKQLPLAAD
jgi:hypothetical protein